MGASENQRPSDEDGDWSDGCGVDPSGADNAMDVIPFSSRGPAPGGRVKPEVIAPGTHIQGTASTSADYSGAHVCDRYRPAGQTSFAASSGTSHSTPAVAGAASLIYHWLQTRYGVTPSPAMLKAYLIAHPTYLTGVSANDTLPSNSQGYGLPNLRLAFDEAFRQLLDQSVVFDNTGETWTWSGAVADPSKPLRIVLAYTDAPGAAGVSPQVNDLNLAAMVGDVTYLGNRFDGQWSVAGGAADSANNYEAVFLPAGVSGALQLTVSAANIAGDGVPNQGDITDQDFALICYNCALQPDYFLSVSPASQTICAPAEASYTVAVGSVMGYDDPVLLSLSGFSADSTVSFDPNPVTPAGVSTLTIGNTEAAPPGLYEMVVSGEATSGVKDFAIDLALDTAPPDAPALLSPADGSLDEPVKPTFSWDAAPQAASYSIQVATDVDFSNVVASANNLANPTWTSNVALTSNTPHFWRVWASNACGVGAYSATWSFITRPGPGQCALGATPNVVYATGFEDGAGGWTSSSAVSDDTWVIATSNPHSGSQHFHADAPRWPSDQRLASPAITLPVDQNPVVLMVWHAPYLERSINGCYDGGILEVSEDGGTAGPK